MVNQTYFVKTGNWDPIILSLNRSKKVENTASVAMRAIPPFMQDKHFGLCMICKSSGSLSWKI